MRTLKLSSKIAFGGYKGNTLQWVIDNDKDWVRLMLRVNRRFNINEQALRYLMGDRNLQYQDKHKSVPMKDGKVCAPPLDMAYLKKRVK